MNESHVDSVRGSDRSVFQQIPLVLHLYRLWAKTTRREICFNAGQRQDKVIYSFRMIVLASYQNSSGEGIPHNMIRVL